MVGSVGLSCCIDGWWWKVNSLVWLLPTKVDDDGKIRHKRNGGTGCVCSIQAYHVTSQSSSQPVLMDVHFCEKVS